MTTRILIGDSNSLSVFGAKTLLERRADTEFIQAENSTILLDSAKTLQPDIVILGDQFDPLIDTLTLVEYTIHAGPSTRIIVIGTAIDGLVIRDLFTMGVCGYLAAGDDLSSCLITSIDMVLREYPYLSPTANAEYLVTLQGNNHGWHLDTEARAILRLIASGCTAREIAAQMNLKLRRVYWVTEKLRARFGASTNEHLISLAKAEGFTCLPG